MSIFYQEKVFPFPDPLNEEQRETLTMLVEPVEKYFQEKGNHLVEKYPGRCGLY